MKPSIQKIIAVASGKGGVGKSTTAVNLAFALQAEGAEVGLLDADIYGPSLPTLVGKKVHPDVTQEKKMLPIKVNGLQTMSIGYLVDEKVAMAWRGPMATGALQQLFNDTLWDNLDYLVIDLPPGTGDIQLTLAQKIPVNGAVIVTTPQDLALLDVRRACEMFQKVKVPVIGVVENMSFHRCSHCGHEESIFGEGGGKIISEACDVSLLGQLPLDIRIRELSDAGNPIVMSDPTAEISQIYRNIAKQVKHNLSLQSEKDFSSFPNIVIKND